MIDDRYARRQFRGQESRGHVAGPRGLAIIIAVVACAIMFPHGAPGADSATLREYSQKMAKLDRDSAEAWFELGKWCKGRMLWARALDAFKRAVDLDNTYTVKAKIQTAEAYRYQGKEKEAMKLLKEVLAADPSHQRAEKMLEHVTAFRKRKAEKGRDEGTAAYQKRKYNEAMKGLEIMLENADGDALEAFASDVKAKTGKDLTEVLAEARTKRVCTDCEKGWRKCVYCQRRGYVTGSKKVREALSMGSGVSVSVKRRKTTVAVCPRCVGLKVVPCETCYGTNHSLGKLTEGEESLVAKMLLEEAEEKKEKGGRSRDLRPADLKRSVAIFYLYKMAEKYDPEMIANEVKDFEKDQEDLEEDLKKMKNDLARDFKGRLARKGKKDDKKRKKKGRR